MYFEVCKYMNASIPAVIWYVTSDRKGPLVVEDYAGKNVPAGKAIYMWQKKALTVHC